MAANTNPIFTVTPNVVGAASFAGGLTTGNNTYTGTSGTSTIFTAGTNGAFMRWIRCKAQGTNVQSLVRFFINNGSTAGTAANNFLWIEYILPATTTSATSAIGDFDIPVNYTLPASYTILAVLATTVAAGWNFTVVGGNY